MESGSTASRSQGRLGPGVRWNWVDPCVAARPGLGRGIMTTRPWKEPDNQAEGATGQKRGSTCQVTFH
jgi:hypothetical protein